MIDISPWVEPSHHSDEERDLVVRQWDDAFSSMGFAAITGHGIEEEIVDRVFQASRAFFLQSLEEKSKHATAFYGDPKGGYAPIGLESIARSNDEVQKIESSKEPKEDLVESFLFPYPPRHYSSPSEEK